MRIDSHQHFWDLEHFDYPWMPAGDSPLRRNYLPPDLQPILDRNRFEGSIAVQATTDAGEARWLLKLSDAYHFIKGIVGWVDLTNPRLCNVLDGLQTHRKFRAIRHPVHDEADDRWLLRRGVLAGLGELQRRRIPYDLLLRPRHLALVPQLVDALPELLLVVDHIAKPLIASQAFDGWAQDIERVAQIPHIHVKLSGMITEADHQRWKVDDLRPYVQHVFHLFGPERLMFGSDWPVCTLAGTWKEALAAFTQALGPLPSEVREQLLGGTAARFYNIVSAE